MPELPEVETIVRGLDPAVRGRRVASVEVLDPICLRQPRAEFTRLLAGQTILAAHRRAKLALFDLSGQATLAVHLKMTGGLTVDLDSDEVRRFARLRLNFADAGSLVFTDVRRFGYCLALPAGSLESWPFFASLGPEPLDLSPDAFAALFTGRAARIKSLLLDQTVIAGIGNIYADESLFRARIHPQTRASDLSAARLKRLLGHLQQVLRQAIAENGSSIRDYRDSGGNPGAFQNRFQVYGRAGQPCPACGTCLRSATVAGRTSTFCPKCQK